MTSAERGFGLVEWLVATLVVLLSAATLAGVLALVRPLAMAAQRNADVDQRLRLTAARIDALLRGAGGAVPAEPRSGSLAWWVPPVFPHRRGVADTDGELAATDDRFTVFRVAPTGATALASPMALPSDPLDLLAGGACPIGRPACGLGPGDRVIVADATGRYDTLVVRAVVGSAITAYSPGRLSQAYGSSGSTLVAGLDTEALVFDAAGRRLRLYRGGAAGMPLADDVESMRLTYFGDPSPPAGPGAPGLASCVVDGSGTPLLAALPPTHGPYVELTLDQLTDGPVCGAAPHRFDADLFRVRVVRVTLRMRPEAYPASSAAERVESREVSFDVAIRNRAG